MVRLLGDLIVEQTQEVVGLLFYGVHGSVGVYRFALTVFALGQYAWLSGFPGFSVTYRNINRLLR